MTEPENLTFKETVAREKVLVAAHTLRGLLAPNKRKAYRDAWATIETYLEVSMRVMDKTPFEEIKDAAVTGEIKARLHGRSVA
jgi:hypothetical protein